MRFKHIYSLLKGIRTFVSNPSLIWKFIKTIPRRLATFLGWVDKKFLKIELHICSVIYKWYSNLVEKINSNYYFKQLYFLSVFKSQNHSSNMWEFLRDICQIIIKHKLLFLMIIRYTIYFYALLYALCFCGVAISLCLPNALATEAIVFFLRLWRLAVRPWKPIFRFVKKLFHPLRTIVFYTIRKIKFIWTSIDEYFRKQFKRWG